MECAFLAALAALPTHNKSLNSLVSDDFGPHQRQTNGPRLAIKGAYAVPSDFEETGAAIIARALIGNSPG